VLAIKDQRRCHAVQHLEYTARAVQHLEYTHGGMTNPATSPSSRLRASQHIVTSPSGPGHHIGPSRPPIGTSERPVPLCTLPM
jgi:hypothetical protein